MGTLIEDLQEKKRNILAAIISGILFWSGWWIIISILATHSNNEHFKKIYYLCGVCGTVAFIMVNTVNKEAVYGGVFSTGTCWGVGSTPAKLWYLTGLLLSFLPIIGSTVIFIRYARNHATMPIWPGIAVILQNTCIFISTMIFKYGRDEEENWY